MKLVRRLVVKTISRSTHVPDRINTLPNYLSRQIPSLSSTNGSRALAYSCSTVDALAEHVLRLLNHALTPHSQTTYTSAFWLLHPTVCV